MKIFGFNTDEPEEQWYLEKCAVPFKLHNVYEKDGYYFKINGKEWLRTDLSNLYWKYEGDYHEYIIYCEPSGVWSWKSGKLSRGGFFSWKDAFYDCYMEVVVNPVLGD